MDRTANTPGFAVGGPPVGYNAANDPQAIYLTTSARPVFQRDGKFVLIIPAPFSAIWSA